MSLLDWLIEPAPAPTFLDRGHSATPKQERAEAILDCGDTVPTKQDRSSRARPVVAVVGLLPGCGATTLARGLAATLARRDHSGTAIVAGTHEPAGSTLSLPAAVRLVGRLGSPARAAGRLCLTTNAGAQGLAPLVLDGAPAEAAHLTVLIAPADAEPSLAELAAHTHNAHFTVVNGSNDGWHERAFLSLPQSTIGARLANAGWEPPGALGRAIARLADAAEEAACG